MGKVTSLCFTALGLATTFTLFRALGLHVLDAKIEPVEQEAQIGFIMDTHDEINSEVDE